MSHEIVDLTPATPVPSSQFEFQDDGAGGAGTTFRSSLDDMIKGSLMTGAGAPASAPPYVGARYLDTSGNREYVAFGTVSVNDWLPLAYVNGDTYSGSHDFSGASVNYPPNSVLDADLADMPAGTFKARQTGTGDPENLDAATVRGILNVEDGANAYSHPNHTGDVTSVGDGAQTIAPNAVGNSKLASMGADTIKGRQTSGGDPQDLTPTQVRTIINVEDGATGDMTGAEIEAITNHDNLQGYVPQEHIRWDQAGAEQIDASRYTAGSGETNLGDNVGVGDAEVFRDKTGVTLNFRRLVASTNMTITQQADTVTFSATGGGGGNAWSDPVNSNIIPDTDSAYQLGEATTPRRFANAFLDALDVAGNIVVTGTVDGRNIAIDGSKLDGIEPGADVTDAGSVAAAGAAMDGGAFHDGFSDYSNNQHVPGGVGAIFNGQGSALTADAVEIVCPFAGNIEVGTLLADQAGNATVTIRHATFANHPTFTLLGTLTLSAAAKSQDSTMSWPVAAGDIIRFETSGLATITYLTADVQIDKS